MRRSVNYREDEKEIKRLNKDYKTGRGRRWSEGPSLSSHTGVESADDDPFAPVQCRDLRERVDMSTCTTVEGGSE